MKLHWLTSGIDHLPPLLKSPPQYLVAKRAPAPNAVKSPQGQIDLAVSPMLVSFQLTVIVRFSLPECEGISV